VQDVPWWGVFSSAAAPVLLIGGWTIAADLQPGSFDPVRQSISFLAGTGAADRWVMTLAFVAVAVCYVATGFGLRPAATRGRLVLIAAGVAGLLVAASPDPPPGGFSLAHVIWAAVGFLLLSTWPLAAWQRGSDVPWALRPHVAACAAGIIALLLAWFLAELAAGGGQIGLAERLLGCAQVLWPLVVVWSCRVFRHRAAA
jgi:hypothetical membrane protein